MKKELLESIFDVTKNYFTIDDTVTPLLDPDDINSEADKTFLYQSRDVKPDPGIGIEIHAPESPPPSPSSPSGSSTLCLSPGPIAVPTPTIIRNSPVQNNPRQSPGPVPRQSPVSAPPKSPQPLPPPPVLRPETIPATKANPVDSNEDEEQEDEEDEDVRNNEEEDEDELMDV